MPRSSSDLTEPGVSRIVHRVGVDAGGTFTDGVVERADGTIGFDKRPSTPHRPAEAVVDSVSSLIDPDTGGRISHGSTVATNAFLEGRTAQVGFITNIGLEDVIAIGRQNRRDLYDLRPSGPRRLVASELVRGISARLGEDGEVIAGLTPEEVVGAGRELLDLGAEVVVVALLHSARYPEQETAAVGFLDEVGIPAVASHAVTSEPREYERWATAVVEAGLTPIVGDYLDELARKLDVSDLRIMLSNGGLVTADIAAAHPAAMILSGPAGGVVGARLVARTAGFSDLVTLDMGGTSCDVAVVPGEPLRTTESEIEGVPLRIPLVDIQTVGAGGGSIARIDPGGALLVGPESAGADPGPACYGQGGGLPTVTDAHLALGHLDPERFLGGRKPLVVDEAEAAIGRLSDALGANLGDTAAAVVAVAHSHLERAVRLVTLERGHDPADFVLVAFGGAGGLYAAGLARSLGVRTVLVPRAAGVLSAVGCLAADTRLDYTRTILEPTEALSEEELASRFRRMVDQATLDLEREGVHENAYDHRRILLMRYRGQAFETTVPFGDGLPEESFHRIHRARYGYSRPEAPTEIVGVRLEAVGRSRPPQLPEHAPRGEAVFQMRSIGLPGGEAIDVPGWHWESLPVGHRSREPAVLFGDYATALVPPFWSWRIDRRGDVVMERAS